MAEIKKAEADIKADFLEKLDQDTYSALETAIAELVGSLGLSTTAAGCKAMVWAIEDGFFLSEDAGAGDPDPEEEGEEEEDDDQGEPEPEKPAEPEKEPVTA